MYVCQENTAEVSPQQSSSGPRSLLACTFSSALGLRAANLIPEMKHLPRACPGLVALAWSHIPVPGEADVHALP